MSEGNPPVEPVATPIIDATPAQTTQPPTEPGPTPAEPQQSEEDKKSASRFAALSKREKALRERESQIKTQEAQQKAAQEQFIQEQSKFARVAQVLADAKNKPEELLKLAGIDYEFLTRYYINNGAPDPVDRVAQLEQKIERERKEREERDIAAQQAALAQQDAQVKQLIDLYRRETSSFIQTAPDEYELIIAHDAYDEVFLLIAETFQQSGKLLSPKQAADQYEKMLEEGFEKALTAKKFQGKLAKKEEPGLQKGTTTARSLSANQVMADPTRNPGVSPGLSRQERIERAAEKLIFKG